MQFRTIFLRYKKCVTEKRTKVTTILICSNLYLLTIQMTIPFNKLPCLVSIDKLANISVVSLSNVKFLKEEFFKGRVKVLGSNLEGLEVCVEVLFGIIGVEDIDGLDA